MTFHCLGECVSFGLWPFWMSPSRNSHHTRQHGTDDGRDVKCQQHANAMYFYPRDALLTATAVYAVALSPSVRPSVRTSVCPSQAGIVPKRLSVGSRKQRHTIARWQSKSVDNNYGPFDSNNVGRRGSLFITRTHASFHRSSHTR